MNATEFVDLAKVLSQANPPSKAGLRSSASRAYYGAFLFARTLIEDTWKLAYPKGKNDHEFTQQLLLNSKVLEGEEIGELLKNLHISRKVADYDLTDLSAETAVNAGLCVHRADLIINLLTQYSHDQIGAKIRAGITQHKRMTNQ